MSWEAATARAVAAPAVTVAMDWRQARKQRHLIFATCPEPHPHTTCADGPHATLHASEVWNHSTAPAFDVQVLLYGRTADGPNQEIVHLHRSKPLGPMGQEWRIPWNDRWKGWGLPELLPEQDGSYASELIIRWAEDPCGPLWEVRAGARRVTRAPGHGAWRRTGRRMRFWRRELGQ